MKWRNLLMPKEIVADESAQTPTFGRFKIEPLERGFGNTIGNALRRTLLSSIQGASVTAVKIDGVLHEFSTIKGVKEDVTDVVLNLKQLILKMNSDEPKFIHVDVTKKGEVTAADITEDPDVEILNKDLLLATCTEKTRLKMDILVGHGRGYVPSEMHNLEEFEIGLIPMDSNFSPVTHVNYIVKNTRVGQRTDYDSLTLEVTTNGSVTPEDALGYAAKIVKDHMLLFIRFEEEPAEEVMEEVDQEIERLKELLGRSVEELELSVRSSNCLKAANLRTLGELVRKTEGDMLKYRNFGRKSLKEIVDIMDGMGLSLGMDIDAILRGEKKLEKRPEKAEKKEKEEKE
ncbi:MAG: DNA-directed RNA polymerase subunit alpha [Candidatus Krumholzibacteria bacterium]|nr:DNA-directed RNA polymerase subunit alpha [Candidatus Krumholzibacteria bacterium]